MGPNAPPDDSPELASFNQTMKQLRDGDADACRKVFDRYAHRLVALARKRMGPQLRGKEDPEDVVQSVFRSFFQRYGAGRLDVSNWENLWAMLALITRRKCWGRGKYYHADRRDVEREVTPPQSENQSTADWDPGGADPTPDEEAVLSEMIQELLSSLLDPKHKQIVLLTLEGLNSEQVSARVPCTERMVHRVLARVREWLQDHGQEPSA